MYDNKLSNDNVAMGDSALANFVGSATQIGNTAVGAGAMVYATTAYDNAALGFESGYKIIAGTQNTVLGCYSGPTADVSNQGDLGYLAGNGGANTLNLGNSTITTINCQVAPTVLSDARVKNNIEPEAHGLDFIMRLRPVTYNYDVRKADQLTGIDQKIQRLNPEERNLYETAAAAKEKIRYTGFIAQEVESAANAIDYDFSGITKPNGENTVYGLAYSEFVVPLVKSVQEQQSMIEAQHALIEKLNARVEQLQKEMDELKNK